MTNKLSEFQTATLREQVRAVGVLLVAVARAREKISAAEASIFYGYVRSTARRLGYPYDADAEAEIVRYLVHIKPTKALLRRAAEAVHIDPFRCQEFPRLFATICTVNGPPTGKEHKAINRVREAIQSTIPDLWVRCSDPTE